MPAVEACELPLPALSRKYLDGANHVDCFRVRASRAVSHAAYVEAFYTTWLFRLERRILALLVARPSTDAQARELAAGTRDDFAAWSVEGRAERQLLMCDLHGRTRSWLMTDGDTLYFGSVVVALPAARGTRRLGGAYALLLGFHKVYSRALLRAAAARLHAAGTPPAV
jgi:hypothetical protein